LEPDFRWQNERGLSASFLPAKPKRVEELNELVLFACYEIGIDQLARAFYYRAYFNMGVIGDLFALLGMPRESIELLLGIDVPGGDPPRPRPSFKT